MTNLCGTGLVQQIPVYRLPRAGGRPAGSASRSSAVKGAVVEGLQSHPAGAVARVDQIWPATRRRASSPFGYISVWKPPSNSAGDADGAIDHGRISGNERPQKRVQAHDDGVHNVETKSPGKKNQASRKTCKQR